MLIFKESLESCPSFWTAALQSAKSLEEPTILRETTDKKIKEKKEKRSEIMALLAV